MDDIHARVPVDRVAALVTGTGEHFEPNIRVQTKDSDTPLRVAPITRQLRMCPTFDDLTGNRAGRLTVLGLSADFNRQWVVRCDCGRYSTRRKKSILNPENTQDRCAHCRYLAFLKRNEVWRRTGKDVDIRDF
jgi:hypothetical protein